MSQQSDAQTPIRSNFTAIVSPRLIDEPGRDLVFFKMYHDPMVAAVATGLGIILLVSIPAVFTFLLQLTTRQPKQDTYEDKDGKATPESVTAYSAKLPKTLIVIFAALTCGTGIATAVLATLHIGQDGLFLENWLSAGASVSKYPSPRAARPGRPLHTYLVFDDPDTN